MSITDFTAREPCRRTARVASALMLGAWLAAGSSLSVAAVSSAQSSAAISELEIRDAWIRWLPSGLPAAGYVTLINRSDRPITLVAASSDAYRDISLHHSVNHDGMSHMEPVGEISVPAKSTLSFAAASYHLMLMQPTHTLAPGDHLTLTLHFAGGAERSVSFEVRAPNGSAAPGDMQGMPGMGDMHGTHTTTPNPPR
jgi:periplasmic copper chaperone A